MMEFDFDADIDEDMFPCIKVIGVGATGAKALSYLKDADTDDVFDTLTISDKNFVVESDPKTDWLFVIADIDDLELAAQVAKSVENYGKNYDGFTLPLITFLILCPSAEDTRLADIPAGFGTWIILPKDKIAATGLTNEALICRVVNMATSMAPGMKKRSTLKGGKKFGYLFGGPDICDVATATGNGGKACIGFGESLDAENNSLQAVKNALKSPLFIEDIRHAKKILLVFVERYEFIHAPEICEAANFLRELSNADPEEVFAILLQADVYETADDGVAAFVLATKFDE